VCGAYEAFSLGTPLILSKKPALQEYFGDAPRYVANTVEEIRQAIKDGFEGHHPTPETMARRRVELESAWRTRFSDLSMLLVSLLD
jgi:hypothetical protein